ncbi:hypothetical protein A2837_01630 [Candidatus Kaiserbacteria bacterium RIFCSPHIGHO2_01_FULL_46_22]|uniref:Type II secretion system protein GspG C-terminal domain-containing protein n=1 Tax=Candidatus Kaiserbacteria bacterium RIFCSPHIGHO2_01_FULL_46_22 TaxID=1798475 RepID=A0A1F6BY61_9BACT|nr:MAG: hypothetical protein A2837_01630 [Candidatus Kaiserbacteria bacterium RIFCSPHIGHO2_01_FULL_46_22]
MKAGFTLVEVLVVIAIITVLMSIVFASVSESRKKARDSKREADIQQVAAALQVWATANGRYPSTAEGVCQFYTSFGPGGCLQVLVTSGLLNALPQDPQNESYSGSWPNDQMYFYDNWCAAPTTPTGDQRYRLWANGERNHNGLAKNWWYNNTIGATPCTDPS